MVRIKGMALTNFIVTVKDVTGVDQEEVEAESMDDALMEVMSRMQTLFGRDEGDVVIRVRTA